MIPGTYNLVLTENSLNVFTFTIGGITTAVGYTAMVDIRAGSKPTDTLQLALTSSPAGGLVLSSDGVSLSVVLTITETQADTLAPILSKSSWSLKVAAPGGATLQYLKGTVAIVRTPTA